MCQSENNCMNRRAFIRLTALGTVAIQNTVLPDLLSAGNKSWNPKKPVLQTGNPLVVQPVLLYGIAQRRPATSWRAWGGLHTEEDAAEEVDRIEGEWKALARKSNFPLNVLSVIKIKNAEEAANVANAAGYDVPIVYAAGGGTRALEACFSEKRNNLIFLRQSSGPVYLWYEIVHNRFLREGGKALELDTFRYPAAMTIDDVVVDDGNELLAKLRALYGVKHFTGKRIVALGGAQGWCCPPAPSIAQGKFKMDIRTVGYDDLEKRILSAKNDPDRFVDAEKWTNTYTSMHGTRLKTDRRFVVNAFVLYGLFKDILREHQTDAFTINDCMTTVIPMAETTACLPLSLMNDEGMLAFCESDFNVIPSGILLHYISGKPVFLNDPTYPHAGTVTCAHCTAPRRMDGRTYNHATVLTHFESDYGAAPKVELPIGTQITMVCPDGGQKQWLGFTGSIEANPFYDICRSQYDIRIQGDWERLLRDHRGFH